MTMNREYYNALNTFVNGSCAYDNKLFRDIVNTRKILSQTIGNTTIAVN